MAPCPCLHSNNHAAGETILLCRNENQNRTRTVVAAGTGATPAAFYLGLCRLRGTLSLPAPHDCDAGGLILSVATTNPAVIPKSGPEIKNRCSYKNRRRNYSSLPPRRLESDAENRCRYGHCRRNHSPSRQRRMESEADLVAATAVAGETVLLCGNEE